MAKGLGRLLCLAVCAVVLAAAPAPTPAAAQEGGQPPVKTVSPEVAQAVDALKAGKVARAAAFLRPAAEAGDPAAQALLGQIYLDGGDGITPDAVEAGRWLRLAAANGEPSGAYALAALTDDGTLTPPGMDLSDATARTREATRLYLVAAEAGSVPGMVETGARYTRGIGTPRDMAAARRWFRQAADAGNAHAQFNLGVLYASGAVADGTPDMAAARPWFEAAAAQGHPQAQYNLGLAAAQGLGQPVDHAAAGRWFAAAAASGLADAQAGLAYLTYQGLGVTKDEATAAELYARAAEQGHLIAQNRLARLYVIGRGVDANMAEAWKWHTLAGGAGFDDPELDARFARDLTPEQRRDGDARAAQWLASRPKP